ncbi:Transposon Ty3-I Gag-Pol polyprotein [Gossypium australe]|uniref:Transposon Ty3-I Gag-Pol polyprotein n=1 Tax=Gossypium australe TaxID=47621 RepID=A0A5B6VXC5_9ROSI|nr:Transposon Ty3-I Gag-Pol polyprotein [Gossypium australe]
MKQPVEKSKLKEQNKKSEKEKKVEKERGRSENNESNIQNESESEKMSIFARKREVRKLLLLKQPILVLMHKECLFETNEIENTLLYHVVSLLQEFEDVFSDEVPSGLPSIRGIQHQIDFVPEAKIPNRPAYRSNPKETKELQKQVAKLMEKGYI